MAVEVTKLKALARLDAFYLVADVVVHIEHRHVLANGVSVPNCRYHQKRHCRFMNGSGIIRDLFAS